MLKAIFIDLDDTIIDTKRTYDDARLAAYGILNLAYAPLSFTYQEYRAFSVTRNCELRKTEDDASLRTPQSLVDAARHFIPSMKDEDEDAILRLGQRIFTTIGPMKPGVEESLLKLSRAAITTGTKIYVLTQGDEEWQKEKIATLPAHIRDVFDDVFIVPNKQADTYCDLLDKMKLHAEDTVMIGDKEGSDIIPALQANMNVYFIPAYSVDFPTVEKQAARYDGDYASFKTLRDCVSHIIDHVLMDKKFGNKHIHNTFIP